MKSEELDIPNEFSRYEKYILEDFERFFPIFKKYQELNDTFFQSLVNASDDLAHAKDTPEHYRIVYTQVSMIGYFLLSQYSKVLTFPIPEGNFEAMFFRLKSAKLVGDKTIVSSLIASSLAILIDIKKTDPKVHKFFSTILSLEIAIMNSDVSAFHKHAKVFKEILFDEVLIHEYPLLTMQVVSDLAYREFRTGNLSYSGWLEIYKELSEALNMDTKRLDCYTMLGGIYRFKGYLEDSYEYYNKAMILAEKIGNKDSIASLIANIADLEHTKGNLEKALFLCSEALKDPEISQSKPSIYINMSEILIKLEKYQEAINYLKKADKLTNKQSPVVNLLYGYVLTKLPGKNYFNEGIKYLEKGGILSEKAKNQRYLAIYHFLTGRVYLDTFDLSSAIKSFETCYSLAILSEFQYVLLSQLYLAETYLLRYKISQLDGDLTSSERYLANVISICHEQELPILADVLYLSGQLLVTLNELVDAEFIFSQSRDLAEENNNQNLVTKCEESIKMIQTNKVEKPSTIINEMTNIINNLAKKSYIKKTERLPKIYFLNVFTNEGAYVYSYLFDKNLQLNDVLISGLVSAIRTMSSEVFASGLRGIDFEGKKLLVENFGEYCGILACDRDSFNARTILYDFVKRFNGKFENYAQRVSDLGAVDEISKEADKMVSTIFGKLIKSVVPSR